MAKPLQGDRARRAAQVDQAVAMLMLAALLTVVIALGAAVLRHTTETLTRLAHGGGLAWVRSKPVK